MAIPTNYFNANRGTVKNQRTGYRNTAYLAPASWFTTIAEPDPAGTDALAVTVATNHIFPTGKGFLEVYVLPNSIEAASESTGDEGALHQIWKPKFIIPGDSPELQNMIDNHLMNDDLILLVKDINCPDGGMRQFGCDCNALTITKANFASGTKNGGTRGWEIESSVACRFFYEGTLVIAA